MLCDVILGLKICLLLTHAQLVWLKENLDEFETFKHFQTGNYHCRCGDDGCFCCDPTFLELLDLISVYIDRYIGDQALLENYEQKRIRWDPLLEDIPKNTDVLIAGLRTCNLLSTAQFLWLRNNRNDFYDWIDIIKFDYDDCYECTTLCSCQEHNNEIRGRIRYHINDQVTIAVNDEGFSE
jgi:hypothetical protein